MQYWTDAHNYSNNHHNYRNDYRYSIEHQSSIASNVPDYFNSSDYRFNLNLSMERPYINRVLQEERD